MDIVRKSLFVLATLSGLSALASPANAFSFISDITGKDLADTEVTVNYQDGTSDIGVLQITGVDSSGVVKTDWDFSVSGNTNFGVYTFGYTGNKLISSLKINVLPASAIFDRILFPTLTPGTSTGNAFSSFSGASPTQKIYSGTVTGALEDVATSLELVWQDGFSDPLLAFVADTDGIEGEIPDPEPLPVPESTAIIGLIVGVGSCCFAVRKR
ncbi:MAG: hypothetical protein J7647_27245 [Cyanobacteria bacterium SBLK]|nr:hypothetical protein [Cyanobacteria bacterium SBLK]